MATIKDVAKMAGVSVGTVSRYLNGAEIKNFNKAQIDEAVKKLEFMPNQIARTLKTNRTFTIGVVIPSLSDIYGTTIVRSIEEELHKSGYNIFVCDSWGKKELEQEKIKILINKRVDGLILYPCGEDISYMNFINKMQLPIVTIDNKISGYECDQVLTDNVNATYTATEWLINNNHKNIGIITGRKEYFTAEERLTGYIWAHKDLYIDLKEEYIKSFDYSESSGYEGLIQLMKLENPPTAIITSNYYTTLGAVKAAYYLDLKIPEELSIIGFDNIGVSEIAKPSLSIIVQPMEEMGKLAAELLLKRIKGEGQGSLTINRLKTDFILRGSTQRIN